MASYSRTLFLYILISTLTDFCTILKLSYNRIYYFDIVQKSVSVDIRIDIPILPANRISDICQFAPKNHHKITANRTKITKNRPVNLRIGHTIFWRFFLIWPVIIIWIKWKKYFIIWKIRFIIFMISQDLKLWTLDSVLIVFCN